MFTFFGGVRIFKFCFLSKFQLYNIVLISFGPHNQLCYTLGPQTSLILQLKLCTFLPISAYFPTSPRPRQPHSTIEFNFFFFFKIPHHFLIISLYFTPISALQVLYIHSICMAEILYSGVCVCVCIKWHFPSQLFALLTLLWWELLAFTKHTPDCGGWGGEVGKATLKRIQTEIMGEETMSNQKKLTRDVRLTGVNSRALEGGARHPSSQGPESSWTHCMGPLTLQEIQPCFTAPSWNYTKL